MGRMPGRSHDYALELTWTGNRGKGTAGYLQYGREHEIAIAGKPVLHASADPGFVGDASRHNPEDLLLAALSSCHMLSYLALAARARIVVTSYADHASGTMTEDGRGGGRFTQVVLHPVVVVADATQVEQALALHHEANQLCFIAQSVNFPVEHEPTVHA